MYATFVVYFVNFLLKVEVVIGNRMVKGKIVLM